MKVRIKKKPKYDSGGLTQANFLNTMTQFPNLYHNYSNVGIVNSNHTGTKDDDITESLGPVDRDIANIEAEKGEVIVKPMLEGMYKVKGKVHEEGGTPLKVDEGSFVYSNSDKLSFTPEQLKMLGIDRVLKTATPAKVIQHLVKPKEYNNLLNILSDPKIDKIKKESALLELEKMQKALGEVAFMQELQKGIKGELPNFAQIPNNPMTEPMKENETQYMKRGGTVYTDGGITAWMGDKYSGKKNASKYTTDQWRAFAKELGFTGTTNLEFQNFLFNDPRFKDIINTAHNNNLPGPNKGMMDGNLGIRWDAAYDSWYNKKNYGVDPNKAFLTPSKIGHPLGPDPAPPPPPDATNVPSQTGPKEDNSRVVQDQWAGHRLKPTGLEKLTTALPGIAALMNGPQYAMLAQMYTPDLRLDRANLEDAKQRTAEQASTSKRMAFQNLNGRQAIAAALGIDADAGQRVASLDVQENEMNKQIGNQESIINLQNKVQDRNFNISQILEVDAKNKLTRQRQDEQVINGLIQSVNNAGQLETSLRNTENMMNMISAPYLSGEKNPDGTAKTYIGRDGKPHQRMGVPFEFDKNRRMQFTSQFGSLDSFGVGMNGAVGPTQEIIAQATSNLMEALNSKDSEKIKSASMAYYTLLRGGMRGPSAIQNANMQTNPYLQMLLLMNQNTFQNPF